MPNPPRDSSPTLLTQEEALEKINLREEFNVLQKRIKSIDISQAVSETEKLALVKEMTGVNRDLLLWKARVDSVISSRVAEKLKTVVTAEDIQDSGRITEALIMLAQDPDMRDLTQLSGGEKVLLFEKAMFIISEIGTWNCGIERVQDQMILRKGGWPSAVSLRGINCPWFERDYKNRKIIYQLYIGINPEQSQNKIDSLPVVLRHEILHSIHWREHAAFVYLSIGKSDAFLKSFWELQKIYHSLWEQVRCFTTPKGKINPHKLAALANKLLPSTKDYIDTSERFNKIIYTPLQWAPLNRKFASEHERLFYDLFIGIYNLGYSYCQTFLSNYFLLTLAPSPPDCEDQINEIDCASQIIKHFYGLLTPLPSKALEPFFKLASELNSHLYAYLSMSTTSSDVEVCIDKFHEPISLPGTDAMVFPVYMLDGKPNVSGDPGAVLPVTQPFCAVDKAFLSDTAVEASEINCYLLNSHTEVCQQTLFMNPGYSQRPSASCWLSENTPHKEVVRCVEMDENVIQLSQTTVSKPNTMTRASHSFFFGMGSTAAARFGEAAAEAVGAPPVVKKHSGSLGAAAFQAAVQLATDGWRIYHLLPSMAGMAARKAVEWMYPEARSSANLASAMVSAGVSMWLDPATTLTDFAVGTVSSALGSASADMVMDWATDIYCKYV